jgi:hypothetical protein
MKVDLRNFDLYQDEQENYGFVKTKKKNVPNEFKKTNNRKFNKPKRVSKSYDDY